MQEVLPWKSLTHGWEEAIRRDVDALQGMGERVRFQIEEVHPPYTVAMLKHLSDSTRVIVEAASQSPSVARFARDAGKAVHDGLDAAAKLLAATTEDIPQDETKPRELDGQVDKLMHTVRLALKGLEPEVLAASALRASGGVGLRHHAVGQMLVVRTDGTWREAEVINEQGADHTLRLEDGNVVTLPLHPWNHALNELPQADFEVLRVWHLDTMREQHSHIADALSGHRLETLQQCVAIDVIGGDASMPIQDAHSLAAWLKAQHEERVRGSECERPLASLLTAGPAAGKTTLLSQVMALSLDGELVPILGCSRAAEAAARGT